MRWIALIPALVILTLLTDPAAAFEVFHSTLDKGKCDRGAGAVPASGSADLNLWIDTTPGGTSPSAAGSGQCSGATTTSSYACAWQLEIISTGDATISGFTADTTSSHPADYVKAYQPATPESCARADLPSPTSCIRLVGGDPANGEKDEVRIGVLHVAASGSTGDVILTDAKWVDANLKLISASGLPLVLATVCAAGDRDCDGLADGVDVCPYYAQSSSLDSNSDGRGDECECGDQTGDGIVTVSDLVAINNAIFTPTLATPLCDANCDLACDVKDLIAANLQLFRPKSTTCQRQPEAGP